MNENYDPNFDYEKEEKKQRARELLEGLQYVQEDQAKHMDQIILNDEMAKLREEYGLTADQEMKIQQALAQNPALNERAYRKSIRKRVETILKGLAPEGAMNKRLTGGPQYRSPEKIDTKEKYSASTVMDAARQRVKGGETLRADEQVEIIDALLGDFLKR